MRRRERERQTDRATERVKDFRIRFQSSLVAYQSGEARSYLSQTLTRTSGDKLGAHGLTGTLRLSPDSSQLAGTTKPILYLDQIRPCSLNKPSTPLQPPRIFYKLSVFASFESN